MEVKARLKRAVKLQTMALGLEGAPYFPALGTLVRFPTEEAFEKAVALYGADAFEVTEQSKAAAKPAAKGGKK